MRAFSAGAFCVRAETFLYEGDVIKGLLTMSRAMRRLPSRLRAPNGRHINCRDKGSVYHWIVKLFFYRLMAKKTSFSPSLLFENFIFILPVYILSVISLMSISKHDSTFDKRKYDAPCLSTGD